MKLGHVVNEKFKAVVSKLLNQDIPLKSAILLKGIVDILNGEIEKYDKTRQALLNQYGRKDDSGNLVLDDNRNVMFDNDNVNLYVQEYNTLCNTDIAVPTLSVEDLGDKVLLSYEDLVALNGLIAH